MGEFILTDRGWPASREINADELPKDSWQAKAIKSGAMRFYVGLEAGERSGSDADEDVRNAQGIDVVESDDC